ncbi:MAG TPA: small ribosomal subunit Rsm22 family protein [Chthoniobacteraceae bacterium]|nr:small ribosomal subunit Rsm22 family protein [Chthoniobacteraceae bacterium]
MESNTSGSNTFSWPDVDWRELRRLRARFLAFDGEIVADVSRDYWESESAMGSYDFTFAERIGWKWDTVLAELQARGWSPPRGAALDWGCGTGVAGRRVVAAWPDEIGQLRLLDQSASARDFAMRRCREDFPHLDVAPARPGAAPALLIISHVLNELSSAALERLIAAIKSAEAVLWVEPGTFAASRKLITARETLASQFHIIAPCTHAARCGMLAAGNERHWCHHFAKIPGFVHVDPGWSRFATEMEIDVSTLPFSYLVLDRRSWPFASAPELSRVIGGPRLYKGFAKILNCQSDGVRELTLQKRDAPDLFKSLKKAPGSLYRWERDGDKIRGGAQLF